MVEVRAGGVQGTGYGVCCAGIAPSKSRSYCVGGVAYVRYRPMKVFIALALAVILMGFTMRTGREVADSTDARSHHYAFLAQIIKPKH